MANIRIKDLTTTFTPTLYTAPTAISAAGNTALTFPTVASDDYIELDGTMNGSRKQLLPRPKPVFKVTVSAGSAAYTATLTLPSTNAVAGDTIKAVVALPASFNPLVEIRNLTSGGTLLGSLVGNTVARPWQFVAEFDGTNWFLTSFGVLRAASIDEVMELRNALAPRGGLAFDGTNGSKAYATLTNQAIGTDSYSISVVATAPSSSPSTTQTVFALAGSTSGIGASSVFGRWSGNDFVFYQHNAGNNGYRFTTFANVRSTYAGKVVHVVITRSGSTVTGYFNGITVTGSASSGGTSPPTFADSIASTYLLLGINSSTESITGTIYTVGLYNLALSQADVTEIYELGGAVPFRFQSSSQASVYASNFSAGLDNWTEFASNQTVATGNVDGVAGVDDTLRIARNTTGYVQYAMPPVVTVFGKAYEVLFDYYMDVGAATGGTLVVSGGTVVSQLNSLTVTEGSWQTSNRLRWYSANSSGINYFSGLTLSAGKYLYIKNASVKRIGCFAYYDADLDGAGYQLHDQSTNKLHALLTTTTGVAWTKAATMGYVKALSDGTTSAQALGGGTILPANCQIVRVRARSLSGTPSITLGTSSGGSQIVASVALSTTWKDLTIALTGGINTAANSLWMTASAANVVEVQLAYEQLPA